MTKKTLLTGVQPTGLPHIGNYFGAIKPAIDMANSADYDSFIFVASYHALNAVKDAKALRDSIRTVASVYLACGLDVEKTVLYNQCDIPEVMELSTILSAFTAKGLMNRAHSYKDKIAKNEAAGKDKDFEVNMGLYTYPILMTADILMFNPDVVPVGMDQIQHLEIARDIANTFNKNYGKDVFKLPNVLVKEDVGLITGTDGRKMSKSYGNIISMFDNEKVIKKAIMGIKTDSKLPEEPKNPDENQIFYLYKMVAEKGQIEAMRQGFEKGGLGYGDAKKMLLEAFLNKFKDMREKFDYYMNNPEQVDKILSDGAQKARKIAAANLGKIKKTIGVL